MWINKIELCNIGTYEGKYVYNFNTSKHINIILGENGNGKTTLLNSIICCLFGTQMFGSDQITQDYKDYIMNLKNRNTSETVFYIQIDFRHINNIYKIKRSFQIIEEDIIEEVMIEENDIQKKDFKVNTILSQNLIKLFFFNGETILELINSKKIEKYLYDLIVQVYDMDTFLVLEKDLNKKDIIEYKEHSSVQYKYNKKEFDKNQKEIKNIENIISKEEAEYKIIINNIDKVNQEIKDRGLLKQNQTQELILKETKIKKDIKLLKNKIDDILKEDLNHLLHVQLLNDITSKLDRTRDSRLENIKKIYRQMEEKNQLDILANTEVSLSLEIEILNKQRLYSGYTFKEVLELENSLNKNLKQLNKVRKLLSQNKKGFEYLNLIDNLNVLEQEKIKSEKVKSQKEKELKNLNKLNKEILSSLEKEEALILNNKLDKNSTVEQEKLKKIIEEYRKIKFKEIYKSIEKATLEIGKGYIFRKDYLIDKIKINKDQIAVFSQGKKIDLQTFSSGEKQAIIVSLILAVIKESHLDLPLVLDTFIARLDSSHTNNLLKYFKNNVSNQIIFLVTNKEMTRTEYDLIKEEVGTTYNLKNSGYKVLMKRGYDEN